MILHSNSVISISIVLIVWNLYSFTRLRILWKKCVVYSRILHELHDLRKYWHGTHLQIKTLLFLKKKIVKPPCLLLLKKPNPTQQTNKKTPKTLTPPWTKKPQMNNPKPTNPNQQKTPPKTKGLPILPNAVRFQNNKLSVSDHSRTSFINAGCVLTLHSLLSESQKPRHPPGGPYPIYIIMLLKLLQAVISCRWWNFYCCKWPIQNLSEQYSNP